MLPDCSNLNFCDARSSKALHQRTRLSSGHRVTVRDPSGLEASPNNCHLDGETTGAFCSADVSAGIIGALFSINLDGSLFSPCANDVGKTN